MQRSRRSYSYVISARLGDAQAGSIVMAFDCAYSQGHDDDDRRLTKAKLFLARRYDLNQIETSKRIGELFDELDERKGDRHGLGCVIDNSRNVAFREVLEDEEFQADLVMVEPGDQLKETAAETIAQREYIIANLANRFGRGHIALDPDQDGRHDIPLAEISEALQGAQTRPTPQPRGVTVLPELDPRDDIALCLGLGVLWSSYMAPESENWQLHQQKVVRPSYDWVV